MLSTNEVEETPIRRLYVSSFVHSCQNHEYPSKTIDRILFVACVSKCDQVVVDLMGLNLVTLSHPFDRGQSAFKIHVPESNVF